MENIFSEDELYDFLFELEDDEDLEFEIEELTAELFEEIDSFDDDDEYYYYYYDDDDDDDDDDEEISDEDILDLESLNDWD